MLTTASHVPQFAVDSTGQVIWYSKVDAPYATRPVAGGAFLQLFGFTSDLGNSGFREIDLAGNLVKETNIECLNSQLALLGNHSVTAVHHEARRLPNGNYLVLTMSERMSTAQGALADIARRHDSGAEFRSAGIVGMGFIRSSGHQPHRGTQRNLHQRPCRMRAV